MLTITPFLWFDTQAEDAAKFYAEAFSNAPGMTQVSKVMGKEYYTESAESVSGKKKGSVMTVPFEIAGMEFVGLNGGPQFKFSEAVSFALHCDTQEQIDYFWAKLSADPNAENCGWLKDKFGLSWQVIPAKLNDIIKQNPENVMAALLKMKKVIISDLERAAHA